MSASGYVKWLAFGSCCMRQLASSHRSNKLVNSLTPAWKEINPKMSQVVLEALLVQEQSPSSMCPPYLSFTPPQVQVMFWNPYCIKETMFFQQLICDQDIFHDILCGCLMTTGRKELSFDTWAHVKTPRNAIGKVFDHVIHHSSELDESAVSQTPQGVYRMNRLELARVTTQLWSMTCHVGNVEAPSANSIELHVQVTRRSFFPRSPESDYTHTSNIIEL